MYSMQNDGADSHAAGTRLASLICIGLGLGWIQGIGEVAEAVGTLFNSRFADEFKIGRTAEHIVLAAAVLPLGLTHSPRPSVIRVAASHSGAFMLLASVSVLLAPSAPFNVLPWGETDHAGQPLYWAPLVVWAVGALVLVAATWIVNARSEPSEPTRACVLLCLVAVAVGAIQWWVTVRAIVGGWLLLRLGESLWDKLISVGILLAYLGTSVVTSGLVVRRGHRCT